MQPIQPVEVAEPEPSPKEVADEPSSVAAPEETVNETTEKEKPAEKAAADEQRAETPHEESDYEDNITVTVPPAHLQSGDAFRDFHLNGRGRHHTSSGMDSSKHHHIHVVSSKRTPVEVSVLLPFPFPYSINTATIMRRDRIRRQMTKRKCIKICRMLNHINMSVRRQIIIINRIICINISRHRCQYLNPININKCRHPDIHIRILLRSDHTTECMAINKGKCSEGPFSKATNISRSSISFQLSTTSI